MAQEVIRAEDVNSKSDIFSFGMTLLHLATLRDPIHHEDASLLQGDVERYLYTLQSRPLRTAATPNLEHLGWEAQVAIRACTSNDPAERPSAVDLKFLFESAVSSALQNQGLTLRKYLDGPAPSLAA